MPSRFTRGPLSVALLTGDDSPQRAVSLASGRAAETALLAAGHTVEVFDLAETALDDIPWEAFDLAFLALQGGRGEDGRLQAELTARDICFTGSDAEASRLATNKSSAKERFWQAGLPTPPYLLATHSGLPAHVLARAKDFGPTWAVKPENQSASIGLTRVDDFSRLRQAIAVACQYNGYALVEPWIAGREFSITVLGRECLPMIEVRTSRVGFDYLAKHHDEATEYRFDTDLPKPLVAQLEQRAMFACRALDTAGLARVDLILDAERRPWILEVNTLPGLSERCLAPKAAEQIGWNLAHLVDWMLADALRRFRLARRQSALVLADAAGPRTGFERKAG